jgi:hypothetical protein
LALPGVWRMGNVLSQAYRRIRFDTLAGVALES